MVCQIVERDRQQGLARLSPVFFHACLRIIQNIVGMPQGPAWNRGMPSCVGSVPCPLSCDFFGYQDAVWIGLESRLGW